MRKKEHDVILAGKYRVNSLLVMLHRLNLGNTTPLLWIWDAKQFITRMSKR